MSRPAPVFYRTSVTRWSYIITGLALTFGLSPFAPREWHDTPSLRWLHHVLPYTAMAALFAVYTLLQLIRRLWADAAAAFLGLCGYGIGLVALLVTIRLERPTNPIAISAIVLACALHWASLRLILIQQSEAA